MQTFWQQKKQNKTKQNKKTEFSCVSITKDDETFDYKISCSFGSKLSRDIFYIVDIVTSYYSPLRGSHYHTLDTVNPAMGMMLCSSMPTFEKVYNMVLISDANILTTKKTKQNKTKKKTEFLCVSITKDDETFDYKISCSFGSKLNRDIFYIVDIVTTFPKCGTYIRAITRKMKCNIFQTYSSNLWLTRKLFYPHRSSLWKWVGDSPAFKKER